MIGSVISAIVVVTDATATSTILAVSGSTSVPGVLSSVIVVSTGVLSIVTLSNWVWFETVFISIVKFSVPSANASSIVETTTGASEYPVGIVTLIVSLISVPDAVI